MYEIMQEGWSERPDRRFSPQMIFAKLITARMFIIFNYLEVVFSKEIFCLQVKHIVIHIQHFIRTHEMTHQQFDRLTAVLDQQTQVNIIM